MNGREARQSGLRLKVVDRPGADAQGGRFAVRRVGAPQSVSHEGIVLRTMIWQPSSFGFAALCFTMAWSVGLGATLVARASLVSVRVRIGRRSRRPRLVAGHGLDHKPP